MDQFIEWRAALMAQIASKVARFGFSVTYVGGSCDVPGCDGEHKSDAQGLGLPPYGYTVGLPVRFGHPELVVVGLSREATSHLLNYLGDAVGRGGRFSAGDTIDVGGLRVRFGLCAPSLVIDGLIATSFGYHETVGHDSMPNPLQVLWPDESGVFPGDPTSDASLRREQPVLANRSPARHRSRPKRTRSRRRMV